MCRKRQTRTAAIVFRKTRGQSGWDTMEACLPLLELLGREGNVLVDDCSNEVTAVLRAQPLRQGSARLFQRLAVSHLVCTAQQSKGSGPGMAAANM